MRVHLLGGPSPVALPALLEATPAPGLLDRLGVQAFPAPDDPGAVDPATAGGAGPGQERPDLLLAAPSPLGLRLVEAAAALAAAPTLLAGDAKPPVPPQPVAPWPGRAPAPPANPAGSALPGPALSTGLFSTGLALLLAGPGTSLDDDGSHQRLAPMAALRLRLLEAAATDRAAPGHRGASVSLRVESMGAEAWRDHESKGRCERTDRSRLRVSKHAALGLPPRLPRTHKVRLAGIDAPERGQAFGKTSTTHLASLVAGRLVTVEFHKRDKYGRLVGSVLARARTGYGALTATRRPQTCACGSADVVNVSWSSR